MGVNATELNADDIKRIIWPVVSISLSSVSSRNHSTLKIQSTHKQNHHAIPSKSNHGFSVQTAPFNRRQSRDHRRIIATVFFFNYSYVWTIIVNIDNIYKHIPWPHSIPLIKLELIYIIIYWALNTRMHIATAAHRDDIRVPKLITPRNLRHICRHSIYS